MTTTTALSSTMAVGLFVMPFPPTKAFGGFAARTPRTYSSGSHHSRRHSSFSSNWSRLFSTSSETSKKDQTFPTWSFDGPCASMEWSSLLDIQVDITAAPSIETVLEADLILVGVRAPPPNDDDKEEEGDDEGDDDDDKEEDPVPLIGMAQELEDALGGDGILSGLIAENNKAFKNGAKAGSTTPVARIVAPGGKAKRIVFVGLGSTPKQDKDGKDSDDDDDNDKKKKNPLEGVGAAVGKAVASQCQSHKKVESCALILPESFLTTPVATGADGESSSTMTTTTTVSTMLRDLSATLFQNFYFDNRYKSKNKRKEIAKDLKFVHLLCEGSTLPADDATSSLDQGRQVASGIILAKDIVNAPHNVLNSESLADTARRIANESQDGCISCQILNKQDCEERGMGAYLGVARGSETEPQFIHLTYKPPGTNSDSTMKKVAVIGKGLLFDTGGYNIKTQMMSAMKFDCGGAAAAMGAARAIGQLQPPGVEVHFIVAACENMINQKAIVPSDILTASNGKTIEVCLKERSMWRFFPLTCVCVCVCVYVFELFRSSGL